MKKQWSSIEKQRQAFKIYRIPLKLKQRIFRSRILCCSSGAEFDSLRISCNKGYLPPFNAKIFRHHFPKPCAIIHDFRFPAPQGLGPTLYLYLLEDMSRLFVAEGISLLPLVASTQAHTLFIAPSFRGVEAFFLQSQRRRYLRNKWLAGL